MGKVKVFSTNHYWVFNLALRSEIMNHFAVQGILQEKTLRYTQEKRAIAEFAVEINPLREEDPKENLKVLYWGESGEKAHNAL